MGVSNGIITAPINLKDPYVCMGVGATANGYDLGYVCSNLHGRINPWAKYKPEIINTPTEITETQRRNNMYGIFIPQISTSSLDEKENEVWQYTPPVLKENWLRITDFIGYSHYSIIPIEIIFPKKLFLDIEGANVIWINIDDSFDIVSNNLLIKDIFYNYLNWYLGVIAYNKGRKEAIWKTIDVTLEDFYSDIEIKVPMLPAWNKGETIEMYAILSKYKYTGSSIGSSPLESDTFYLQYEIGKGHSSAIIGIRYSAFENITIVENPKITFSRTALNDGYYWFITELDYTVKNNILKNFNIHMYSSVEDDYNNMYNFENSTSFLLQANSSKRIFQEGTIYIPEKTSRILVSIGVYSDDNTGGVIFYKYYDIKNDTWYDY